MLDAIHALGAEDDPPAVRAKRLTELLEQWPETHARVRQMRQAALKEMQDGGMSLRAISAETDISFGRVREIIQGVTKRDKPGKQAPAEDAPGTP
ncbi:hypothetical protein ACFV27_00710 [Streptomyces antimycoticus]|uniref:hypothetical protein n=1 Tax=Streptomyces antimycoticus TaxID=68175 RepID=UPI0036B7BE79